MMKTTIRTLESQRLNVQENGSLTLGPVRNEAVQVEAAVVARALGSKRAPAEFDSTSSEAPEVDGS